MYVPFSSLPPQSKVWVYQADRELNSAEIEILSEALVTFTGEWQVHGHPLEASFEIRYNRFVILAANDTASGCSIDTSVRVMKELGGHVGIDFFNRNIIPFEKDGGLFTLDLPRLKQGATEGLWDGETIAFNNAVSTMSELQSNWRLPARETWLKRYISMHKTV